MPSDWTIPVRCPCCGSWQMIWQSQWDPKVPQYCEGCAVERTGIGRGKCKYCEEYPGGHWDDPKPTNYSYIHLYMRGYSSSSSRIKPQEPSPRPQEKKKKAEPVEEQQPFLFDDLPDPLPVQEPEPKPKPDRNINPCLALYGPGPEGQKCQGCVHLRYPLQRAGRYWKCDLRGKLTHGPATDHRVNWPACGRYEKRTEPYYGG